MTSVLVWVLVYVGAGGYSQPLTYSPPLPDLETCQALYKEIQPMASYPKAKCIQLRILK